MKNPQTGYKCTQMTFSRNKLIFFGEGILVHMNSLGLVSPYSITSIISQL